MIQSYYDSDDDVCWGPVTLKELRRTVMSTRSKEDIECRRSIHCDPSFLDDLEKRAEEITEITTPNRRTMARRSSLPLRKEESDKDTCADHEINHMLIYSSDEDIFIKKSLVSPPRCVGDSVTENKITRNIYANDGNNSGSVIFEGAVSINDDSDYITDKEHSSIELFKENIITDETSRSDDIGIGNKFNELKVTDLPCSDTMSIDLTTTEINEQNNDISSQCTHDVAYEQISTLREPDLRNSEKKREPKVTEPLCSDTMSIDLTTTEINEQNNDISSQCTHDVAYEQISTLREPDLRNSEKKREPKVTEPLCSDAMSIDLTTTEINVQDNDISSECTYDVAYEQISTIRKPDLQNSEKKTEPKVTDPLCSDTLSIDLTTTEINEQDNNISSELTNDVAYKQISTVRESDLRNSEKKTELKVIDHLCSDSMSSDLTTTDINEQDNDISSECTYDVAYEQISTVSEPDLRNSKKKTDLPCSRNIIEEINESCNRDFVEICEDTSDDDGIVLKLNASNISKRCSSIRFSSCDEQGIFNSEKLSEIVPMDPLLDDKYVHVITKEYVMDNVDLPNKFLKCNASNGETNYVAMESGKYKNCLVEREENKNNDYTSSQNVPNLTHSYVNVSSNLNNDSIIEVPYSNPCRLEKEKLFISSSHKIDVILKQNESHDEFERNCLTSENNHPGETCGLDGLSAQHECDHQGFDDSFDENPSKSMSRDDLTTHGNNYHSKIAFDAGTPKYSNCSVQIFKNSDPLSPDSFNFNDTLEEMDKAFEQGPNYSMSVHSPKSSTYVEPTFKKDTIVETTPLKKNIISNNSSERITHKKPTGKYCNVLSSVAAYITTPSPRPIDSQFKLPRKPIKQKMSPAVKSKYKSVASPVGVYIKNAPTTPLYEKVTPTKNIQKRMKTCSLEKLGNEENLSVFPEVLYKPAQRTVVRKGNDIHLPNKIDCLLPVKSNVIKHEARTVNHNSSVSRKLLENDLTLNMSDSFINASSQDTSIHLKKQTYISKFSVTKD